MGRWIHSINWLRNAPVAISARDDKGELAGRCCCIGFQGLFFPRKAGNEVDTWQGQS
jgi:hypothetical protein